MKGKTFGNAGFHYPDENGNTSMVRNTDKVIIELETAGRSAMPTPAPLESAVKKPRKTDKIILEVTTLG